MLSSIVNPFGEFIEIFSKKPKMIPEREVKHRFPLTHYHSLE